MTARFASTALSTSLQELDASLHDPSPSPSSICFYFPQHIRFLNSMQRRNQNQTDDNMLSFAPTPIFSGSWDHRPSAPSPLTSSPIRASSPLSPIDRNSHPQRQIQSSPIQPIKFKFASRPTRPNPVVRKREDVQEGRRRLFLNNVRQKSEDKAWQRRDIEGQVCSFSNVITRHLLTCCSS